MPRKQKGRKQNKAQGQKPKIPVSTVAKAVARYLGAGGMADGLIDSGVKAISKFTGLPIGVRAGRVRGRGSTIQKRDAPVNIGFATRTPDWDFNRAPDLGNGPGIRLSGRFVLGYVVDGWSSSSTVPQAYIGVTPNYSTNGHPVQAFIFSPAAGYPGANGTSVAGMFGSSDSIHQELATCFTRYRVTDAVVEYVPTCNSTTSKNVTVAWVPDAAVIANTVDESTSGTASSLYIAPYASNDQVLNIPDAVTTSAWMPAQIRLPLDGRATTLLYVNSDDFASPPLSADDDQFRQLFCGGFMVCGSGMTATSGSGNIQLGVLYANVTLDLYQLALNAAPAFVPNSPPDLTETKRPSKPSIGTRFRAKRRVAKLPCADEMKIPSTTEGYPPLDSAPMDETTDEFVSVPGNKKRKLVQVPRSSAASLPK